MFQQINFVGICGTNCFVRPNKLILLVFVPQSVLLDQKMFPNMDHFTVRKYFSTIDTNNLSQQINFVGIGATNCFL